MPVMDGIEATTAIRLRERATGRRVRIVAMTAHAQNRDRERCLAAGMDGYLSKPINPLMLFAVVEQEAQSRDLLQADIAVARMTFDEEALLQRVSGDRVLMAEVIRLFLEDVPPRLAAIKAAVTGRDSEALRAAAHALRGAAANLSAARLVEAASVLERLAAGADVDAADAAWRQLSVEATHVIDVLRRHAAAVEQPYPCAS
jgi:CheY-like chemotaxis protein